MRISKLLNVLVLLTFLLPFFYTGCGSPTADELAAKAMADSIRIADSLSLLPNLVDSNSQTINIEDLKSEDSIQNTVFYDDTISNNSEDVQNSDFFSDKTIAEKIVEDFPFSEIIINPSDGVVTGFGSILMTLEYFSYISVFFAFILLIIGLVIKFIEPKSIKTLIILDAFTLLCLVLSSIPSLGVFYYLWGYWVSVIFASIILIFDSYILLKYDKKN